MYYIIKNVYVTLDNSGFMYQENIGNFDSYAQAVENLKEIILVNPDIMYEIHKKG